MTAYETLADDVWRGYEHLTIQRYLSADLDAAAPPSVARAMVADGYTLRRLPFGALIKTERYAAAGAAISLHADSTLEGHGQATTFKSLAVGYEPSDDDAYISNTPFDQLSYDITAAYSQSGRALRREPRARFNFLLERYMDFTSQDVDAAPSSRSRLFVLRAGGLADEIRRFFPTLQPAVDRYAAAHELDNTARMAIYHSLIPLALGAAAHHLSSLGAPHIRWHSIDPNSITVVARRGGYSAVDAQGQTLGSGPRRPVAPAGTALLIRPRLKCPAHANITLPDRSPTSTALRRGLHATVNEAAHRQLV